MRLRGVWSLFGVCLVLSGCAGTMGSQQAANLLAVLSESEANAPKCPLTESGSEAPTACWRVTIEETSEQSGEVFGAETDGDDTYASDVLAEQAVLASEGPAEPLALTTEEALALEELLEEDEAFELFVADEQVYEENSPGGPHAYALTAATLAQPTPADGDEPLYDERFIEQPDGETEVILTPGPLPHSPFKTGKGESDLDRASRQVTDVPIDIRPTEGELPVDLAATRYADEPVIDETWPSDMPSDIFCSYTPWTICFRPLYFEDIKLERYGCNVGYLQTGLSGVRFFSTVAALPYKMTVRPPRSCQCSNGFSRCGDCPLPGYGRREFRLDASLIEAAAVAGVVYILP